MPTAPDWRYAPNGTEIPTESYSDQPYVVQTGDGAWLCVVTTGPGVEGQQGQHIITLRSTDLGRTWSAPVAVEPAGGPEASYAVLLKCPGGRIFVFYNHNTDRVTEVRRCDGLPPYQRVDSLGHFVCKFSDDHGRTWSPERYDLPVREFACDRENVYGGALRFFWNVGKPFIHDGAAFVSLHKVGKMGGGFFAQSEGVLIKSDNLLTESDPLRLRWETLPDGDVGLRTPPGGGAVSEEQSYSVLSDGSFYVVYRSIDGHPVESYSHDGGHTWDPPRYKRFASGRPMKHPRAANFAWRCNNGRFLYWFHNHGGRFIRDTAEWVPYDDRNPVWLSAGEEVDTPRGREIRWSEPEIALYEDDPYIRMSYPDLVEEDGGLFLTETNKDHARVHEVDAGFLGKLFGHFDAASVTEDGLLLNLPEAPEPVTDSVPMPALPQLLSRDDSRLDHGTRDHRAGFSLELRLRLDSLEPGQVLLDSRTADGRGVLLHTAAGGALELALNDGRTENRWACDPGLLRAGESHHVVATVDGGPKVITWVVDGILNDGGEHRQFGWGRFSPNLRTPEGAPDLHIGPSLSGEIACLRIYGRALMTSEAVGNWRSGQ